MAAIELVEEVETVAVFADSSLIEIPAMLISILALAILVESVSLDALETVGVGIVVSQAIGVLLSAESFGILDISSAAGHTISVLEEVAMRESTNFVSSDDERVLAFLAASVAEGKAAFN